MIKRFWNWLRGAKKRPASIDEMRGIERVLRKVYAQMPQKERYSDLGEEVKRQLFKSQSLSSAAMEIRPHPIHYKRLRLRAKWELNIDEPLPMRDKDTFIKGMLERGLMEAFSEEVLPSAKVIELESPDPGREEYGAELDIYVKIND